MKLKFQLRMFELTFFAIMEKIEAMKSVGDQSAEPRDTYKIAYIIHFLLGAGNLLPWNAFITAVDYFGFLYPAKHVEKVFSVAYMSSSLLVLVLVICWGGWGSKLSYRLRMNLGFSMFALSLLATPVIDRAWSSSGSDGAYRLIIASVVICGLADGLIGGSLIGSAGKLPKQYMQAVFAGTASSGVLVSILRIITKASLPQTPQGLRTSAHFYFIVSTIITLCCCLGSNLLHRLPVMQQHHRLLSDDPLSSRQNFWTVARKIRLPSFGVLLIYIVTLSIFPGFISEKLESKLLRDWYPILLITIYNVSDFLGKSLTAIYVPKSVKKTAWACTGRLMFYPLFAACLHGPKWLKNEVPLSVLTSILGLTNGYLTSVIMILTPKTVTVAEAEIAAIVMILSLGIGLVGGSVLGWFWMI